MKVWNRPIFHDLILCDIFKKIAITILILAKRYIVKRYICRWLVLIICTFDGDVARMGSYSTLEDDGNIKSLTIIVIWWRCGKTGLILPPEVWWIGLPSYPQVREDVSDGEEGNDDAVLGGGGDDEETFFCLQIQDILYQFWLIMWGEKVFQGLNIHRERIHLATLKPLPFHRTLNSFIAHLWEGRRPQCAFL